MGLLSGTRPHGLGVRNGKLKEAPSSPNAVSSQAEDRAHAIAPLGYLGTREEVVRKLRSIIGDTPRARIIEQTPDYLYVEYESALLGFVDDVEFYLPAYEKVIHVRSASRLGYSDFGVNRKRIEDIREKLQQAAA
ncbi:MAG TPA: DUF1499 domain-containing protein [Burkholderiales bacterium]